MAHMANLSPDKCNLFDAVPAEAALLGGLGHPTAQAMAAAFPWRDYRSFADIGCAQGRLTVEIAAAHPHLTGFGFDLPAVRPAFERYVAHNGLDRRVLFSAGDFFKGPLPGAEVLVMSLCDRSLPDKRLLLRKAHEALPAGGALIVYDAMIDDDRSGNAFGRLMTLSMPIETPEGFDYAGAECAGWMREAGFRGIGIEPLHGAYSMAVGYKQPAARRGERGRIEPKKERERV